MIIFHEGLPRSGKSYEACAEYMVPQLKKGRRVLTNIDGINYTQFAALTGQTEDWLKENLVSIHSTNDDEDEAIKEEIAAFLEHAGHDTLIVWDEIQDHFPSERNKLTPEWRKFITQHGHRGLDILLMGQDRRDVHAMWRRRIQRVIVFNKLSAVGQENRYNYQVFEATKPEVFKRVSSGVRKYDSKYFGLYKSHVAEASNTGNLNDDRANLFKSNGFKIGVPGFLAIAVFAGYYAYQFLTGQTMVDDVQAVKVVERPNPAVVTAAVSPPSNSFSEQLPEPESEPEPEPLDVFHDYTRHFKPRLAGYVTGSSDRLLGLIEFRDDHYRLKDQFSFKALVQLGWDIQPKAYGVQLFKDDVTIVVTQWPLDHKLRERSRPTRLPRLAEDSRRLSRSYPRSVVLSDNSYWSTSGRQR